ncbi:MAG: hypothetical protein ACTHW2_06450 [Tissierella sp.]|uniref:hypothetical protein n=1 Tax=Tissierella sp. TaxID=41274 RepID=UPI003F94A3B6
MNKDIRNISKEKKMNEQKKIDSFQIIMGLLIGAFLYFGYYMLMTEHFKRDPFKWPYILISIYFVLATISFAYAHNKVSAWVENNENTIIDLLIIPQTIVLISYIFGPVIFIRELF